MRHALNILDSIGKFFTDLWSMLAWHPDARVRPAMADPAPAPAPAPAPLTPTVQNWTPFRSDFPTFVLGTAFDVVRAGKITKDGAATLTHCAVELELWALGQYFGTKPLMGMASPFAMPHGPGGGLHELRDEEAHALLQSGPDEPGLVAGILPTPISTSGGTKVALVALPFTAPIALKLALWLLKTAAAVLL